MINRINEGIRSKFNFGNSVKCLSIARVEGGFHAVYQKADGTIVAIDCIIQNIGNNSIITYQICEEKKTQKFFSSSNDQKTPITASTDGGVKISSTATSQQPQQPQQPQPPK